MSSAKAHADSCHDGKPVARDDGHLRKLFSDHLDFVWRFLRRLGVPPGEVDDATQQVFVVAARKLDCIESGKERAFLFGTAMRVAADFRRSARARCINDHDSDALDALGSPGPGPDELLDRKRARALLQEVLDKIPIEQRVVFILFELEGMTAREIAEYLDVPRGTVASRLRSARATFRTCVKRLQARTAAEGSPHG